MNFYKAIMKIGEQDRNVVEINIPKGILDDKKEETEVTFNGCHHIHIIDRSGSMYREINKLIENVKQTLDVMSDDDLVSVIWFSGKSQYKTLLKGASKNTPNIKELLDSLKSTLDCTCFSEALNEADVIIDDLIKLQPNIAITLFTDGCPVVPDLQQELKDISDIVEKLSGKVIAINTVGYGAYYDADLLDSISNKTALGKRFHSDNIDEYMPIFEGNYTIYNDLVQNSVEIEQADSNIFYMSRNSSTLTKGKMKINFLNKSKNQFFIIGPDKNEFKFTFNDTEYDSKDINKSIISTTAVNLYYGLAYEMVSRRSADAKYVIANTKDKYLYDKFINSFTSTERQDMINELKNATFKGGASRLIDGEIPANYIPPKNAFCFMNLLAILQKDEKNVFIPVKDYNRIGLKVTDTFNLFKANDEEVETSFTNLVWNEKQLNLSLRYMVNGTVSINPQSADRVGLPHNVDSRIYRNQTIIKDGYLNIPKFEGKLTEETYKEILKYQKNNKASVVRAIKTLNDGRRLVKFNLNLIPLINEELAENLDSTIILNEVTDLNKFKAAAKVLKYLIDKSTERKSEWTGKDNTILTESQIEVLKEHGLNPKYDYVGVNNETAEKNENDYYESRLIEFALKGWSTLPPVEKVINADISKLNQPGSVMREYYDSFKDLSYTDLEKKLADFKIKVLNLQSSLAFNKLSKVLTSTWWNDCEVDNKGYYNITSTDKNNQPINVIIKTDRVKNYF